jgi:hypothetical protein
LTYNALLESQRSSVGFFLGKSVVHTNWNDLTARLSHHIQDKLQTMRTMQSFTAPSARKPAPIPTSIPIHLNPNTVSVGPAQSQVLAIYVGDKDKIALEQLLKRYPFYDVEIVADSWKRSDTEEYIKRLHLHNAIEENSTGIRITDTTEDMRDHLRVSRYSAPCSELIIDIADARDTPTNGLVHVQCLVSNKPMVTQWIKELLDEFISDNPDDNHQPVIAGLTQPDSPNNSIRTFDSNGTKNTKNTQRPTRKIQSIIPITASKFAAILPTYVPTSTHTLADASTKRSTRTVPKAINVKVRSYAQILADAGNINPRDNRSNASKGSDNGSKGSDNSTLETTSTTKTLREIELEHMNAELQQETKVLQTKYNDLCETNAGLKIRVQQLEEETTATSTRMYLMEHQLRMLAAKFLHIPPTAQECIPSRQIPEAPDPTAHNQDSTHHHDNDKGESKRKRNSPQKDPKKRNPSYPEYSDKMYLDESNSHHSARSSTNSSTQSLMQSPSRSSPLQDITMCPIQQQEAAPSKGSSMSPC